ncbi:hypothetical protein [Streptomyces alboflavus]|uniref:hypothetical protein n=1 Tax=Streptomyces alboflavus TaxID=67267 RepID=UPI0036CD7D4D
MADVILPWWAWAPLLPLFAAAHLAYAAELITRRRLVVLRYRLLLPLALALAAQSGSAAATVFWLALILLEAWAHHVAELDAARRRAARVPAPRNARRRAPTHAPRPAAGPLPAPRAARRPAAAR